MTADGWPFLIGRTRSDAERVVVMPGFMTGPSLSGALRDGDGREPTKPDTALLQELDGAGEDPVTLIYRIVVPQASDYGITGITGQGALTDAGGQPIALTEGLALRRRAAAVTTFGLAVDHLDQARTAVAPAYRAFWAQGGSFRPQPSSPFPVASVSPERRALTLETVPPWAGDAVG